MTQENLSFEMVLNNIFIIVKGICTGTNKPESFEIQTVTGYYSGNNIDIDNIDAHDFELIKNEALEAAEAEEIFLKELDDEQFQ